MKRTYWLIIALVVTGVMMLAGVARTPDRISHAQTGGALEYGASAHGTISADMPLATYTFNGSTGDLVHVDVRSLGTDLDPTVDLIGPDQQPLASSQHNRLAVNSRNANIALFLPQSGMYTLMVGGMNGSTGDFVLRLQGRAPVSSTPLVYGQAVQVTIAQNAQPQYYTFEAQDCPTILTVTNLSDGQPFTFPFVAKVRNQQGEVVALLRGGDAQEDRVTVAPLSGRYEVEVLSDDPALAGMISLLVSCAEPSPDCPPVGGEGEAAAGGEGVAVAEGPTCAPCPSCPEDLPDEPVCPDMDVRIVVADRFVPTWNAVPGADYYWVHLYGLRDGDEFYLGAVGAPGDATALDAFHHLPADFHGFRFVVEAIQGEEVICVGEDTVMFAQVLPLCQDFDVTWDYDSVEHTVTWTWDGYPGADEYNGVVRFTAPDGGEAITVFGVAADLEGATSFTTFLPDPSIGDWSIRVEVMVGGEAICVGEGTFHLGEQQEQQPTCPNFGVTAELVDPDTLGVTLTWPSVPDADHYQIHMYGLAEEVDYFGATGAPGDATSHTFDHLPQLGYTGFTFVVDAVGADGTVLCSAETTLMLEGQGPVGFEEPVCPDMNLTATVFDPEVRGTTLTWNPVPDTANYQIHMYGLAEEVEYFGVAGALGEADSYTFDHLPPDYPGFHFVVEAIGTDGTVICSDEVDIEFEFETATAQVDQTCANFAVTGQIDDLATGTVTWTWDAYPGADEYHGGINFTAPDGLEATGITFVYDADQTSYTAEGLDIGHWRLEVAVFVDGNVVCMAEDTVEIGAICPDMNLMATVTNQVERNAELGWNPIPGADHYQIQTYGLAEEPVFIGTSSVPMDATEDRFGYRFEHLALDYARYAFVVEAVGAGGTVICFAQDEIEFEQEVVTEPEEPVCANFAVTAELVNPDTFAVDVNWTAVPDTTHYRAVLLAQWEDGSTDEVEVSDVLEPTTTHIVWDLPFDEALTDTWNIVILATMPDETLCRAETVFTLDDMPEFVDCPDFTVTAEVVDFDIPDIAIDWSPMLNVVGYQAALFAVADDGSTTEVGLTDILAPIVHGMGWELPVDAFPTDDWQVTLLARMVDGGLCMAQTAVTLDSDGGQGGRGGEPSCDSFVATLTRPTFTTANLEWTPFPFAEQFFVYVMTEDRQMVDPPYPQYLERETISYRIDNLPPGSYIAGIGPWLSDGGVICSWEFPFEVREPNRLAEPLACDNFDVWIAEDTAAAVTFDWSDYPDAENYVAWIVTEDRELLLPFPIYADAPYSISSRDGLEPGSYFFGVGPWFSDGGTLCGQEVPFVFGEECEDFSAWIVEETPTEVIFDWSVFPGADRYVIYILAEDGSFVPAFPHFRTIHPWSTASADIPDLQAGSFVFGVLPWFEDIGSGLSYCRRHIPFVLGAEEPAQCEDFTAEVTDHTGTAVTLEWSDYPEAERFIFYVLDEDGEMLPGYPVLSGTSSHELTVDWLEPGTYTLVVGPWASPDGTICVVENIVVIEDEGEVPSEARGVPCTIRTEREDVWVHVGPGRNRNVFTFLPTNQDFTVIGRATDAEGNAWWEIDKTQIPGHEAVNSLWVAQADVTATGDCEQVQESEAPPIVPDTQPPPSGGWQGCGSCATCGHPANECVTSPEGACLWDPTTCPPQGLPPEPDQDQPATCYQLGTAVGGFGIGSISVLTPTNCTVAMAPLKDYMVALVEKEESLLLCSVVPPAAPSESTFALQSAGYLPGTVVTVQYNPPSYPSCYVQSWSGCGAGGSGNTTSFTMTGSCTITADVHCS